MLQAIEITITVCWNVRAYIAHSKVSNSDSPEVLCMSISKFPGYVRERWNRKVLSIRRTHKRDPVNQTIGRRKYAY